MREVRSLSQLGIPVERTRPFLVCLAAGQDHADDCPASLAAYRDAIAELTGRRTGRLPVVCAGLHRSEEDAPGVERYEQAGAGRVFRVTHRQGGAEVATSTQSPLPPLRLLLRQCARGRSGSGRPRSLLVSVIATPLPLL